MNQRRVFQVYALSSLCVSEMPTQLVTGNRNLASIPEREQKKATIQRKAAVVQITRSWHGEVATKNIDMVQRAGCRWLHRPACFGLFSGGAQSVPLTAERWLGCLLLKNI